MMFLHQTLLQLQTTPQGKLCVRVRACVHGSVLRGWGWHLDRHCVRFFAETAVHAIFHIIFCNKRCRNKLCVSSWLLWMWRPELSECTQLVHISGAVRAPSPVWWSSCLITWCATGRAAHRFFFFLLICPESFSLSSLFLFVTVLSSSCGTLSIFSSLSWVLSLLGVQTHFSRYICLSGFIIFSVCQFLWSWSWSMLSGRNYSPGLCSAGIAGVTMATDIGSPQRFFHMPRFQHQAPRQVFYKRPDFAQQQAMQQLTFDGKRMRKAVNRKTIDYNPSVIRHLEVNTPVSAFLFMNTLHREEWGSRLVNINVFKVLVDMMKLLFLSALLRMVG